ncbi:hypothetical protein [Pseudonocardia adelaidensis]|uniref:Uncharacterized protein n=1 Tax=Pseudonocardia adelaidensis TaxID=648754 RepID=A0ABP9NK36_9PSEU
MRPVAPGDAPVVVLVRRCLVALTVIGILATAFELASERHWNSLEQLIPWLALAVLIVATTLFLLPGERGTVIIRVLGVVVLGASGYGVLEHILVNFEAGELDQRFADTWASLPLLEKGWYAVTKTVGPAPTLAPGVLGQTALLLLLATLCTTRHRVQPDPP